MYTIKVKNLRIRAIVGINPDEREHKQDLLVNYEINYKADNAKSSDKIEDTLNYKTINKQIIDTVESSKCFLLEKLVSHLLEIISSNPEVLYARIEVDKVGALRYADSVSITEEFIRNNTGSNNYYLLSMGSNIDSETNISKATELLNSRYGIDKTSQILTTKAVETDDQNSPDFLNCVISISTDKSPYKLKQELLALETELGRTRDPNNKSAPRTIDIDIIGVNGLIIDKDFYTKEFIRKLVTESFPDMKF